jgi:hypothetical protein
VYTYIFREIENVCSYRLPTTIRAANITTARRRASALQVFQGTVLTLENENGELICYKENGKWKNN